MRSDDTFHRYGKGGEGFRPDACQAGHSDCELIMGFRSISRAKSTAECRSHLAYASTGSYWSSGRPRPEADPALPKAVKWASQSSTPSQDCLGTHPNIVMHVYESDSQMIEDLMDTASPRSRLATAHRSVPGEPPSITLARLQALSEKHMAWNLVALYASESQGSAIHSTRVCTSSSARELDRLIKPISGPSRAPRPAPRPAGAPDSRGHRLELGCGSADPDADTADTAKAKQKRPLRPPALYTAHKPRRGACLLSELRHVSRPGLDGQPAGYSGPHSRARISPIPATIFTSRTSSIS